MKHLSAGTHRQPIVAETHHPDAQLMLRDRPFGVVLQHERRESEFVRHDWAERSLRVMSFRTYRRCASRRRAVERRTFWR